MFSNSTLQQTKKTNASIEINSNNYFFFGLIFQTNMDDNLNLMVLNEAHALFESYTAMNEQFMRQFSRLKLFQPELLHVESYEPLRAHILGGIHYGDNLVRNEFKQVIRLFRRSNVNSQRPQRSLKSQTSQKIKN